MTAPRTALLCTLAAIGIGAAAHGLSRGSATADPDRTPRPAGGAPEVDAEHDEEGLAEGRARWIEAMHGAPPVFDWRTIERGNGDRATERRNLLATSPHGPEAGTWTERGSANQAGRMRTAAPSPSGERLYAGAENGGVWTTTPDGADWRPLGDNLYGGAHHVVVLAPPSQGAPDVLLVATGGGSLHRSLDEGATWITPSGLPTLVAIRNLARSDEDSPRVWLLAEDSGREWGLYRSTDAGASFTSVLSLDGFPGDVWVPRDGTAEVYVYVDDSVLRSVDGGDTFTQLDALGSGASYGELTGCEAGAPRLWVISHASSGLALYRSDDAGETWLRTGPVDDFYGSYSASRVDPDLFVFGDVEAHATRDGGATFTSVSSWPDYYEDPASRLHADVFGLQAWEDPPDGEGGERWYIGTDGGLYTSDDGLSTFQNVSLEGLRVSQYYSTITSTLDPSHVEAGSQDQGMQVTAGQTPDGDLFRFEQTVSGDYGHLTSGDGTLEWVFSTYPGYILILFGEDEPRDLSASFPSGETYEWLPPVVADPVAPDNFLFCASHLYYYTRTRTDWAPTLWSDQDFGASTSRFISALAISPLDPTHMWAATDAGRVYFSTDQGVT